MAEKDDDLDLDVAEGKKGGKMKLIIIVAVVVLLGGGGTAAMLLMGGDPPPEATAEGEEGEQEAAADEEAAAPEKKKKKKKKGPVKAAAYFDLTPPFVVNLNDEDSGVRYLQVSVSLMVDDPAEIDRLKLHLPVIKHHLALLFGEQKFEDIKSREGKLKLQEKALEVVQSALEEVEGDSVIEGLFLPSIVAQ